MSRTIIAREFSQHLNTRPLLQLVKSNSTVIDRTSLKTLKLAKENRKDAASVKHRPQTIHQIYRLSNQGNCLDNSYYQVLWFWYFFLSA
jgi:hypothetical protein